MSEFKLIIVSGILLLFFNHSALFADEKNGFNRVIVSIKRPKKSLNDSNSESNTNEIINESKSG